MNAAFLLVTAAWLAGADPAPGAIPPATAAPAATIAGCGCGSCADACCDPCEGGHRLGLLARLRARKAKADCCEPVCAPAAACAPACAPAACDTCCEVKARRGLLHRRAKADCCEPVCAPACQPAASCGGACGAIADTCCAEPARKHPLARLFGRRRGVAADCCGCGTEACSTCGASVAAPIAAPVGTVAPKIEPIQTPKKELPKGKVMRDVPATEPITNVAPLGNAPKGDVTIEAEGSKSPFELNRRYESRVGHAPNYSWVTGQLESVHTDGGNWVLRYAPLWKDDPNGGSLVLAGGSSLDGYRNGDLVTVHGEIVNQPNGASPLYRIKSIDLVDRSAK